MNRTRKGGMFSRSKIITDIPTIKRDTDTRKNIGDKMKILLEEVERNIIQIEPVQLDIDEKDTNYKKYEKIKTELEAAKLAAESSRAAAEIGRIKAMKLKKEYLKNIVRKLYYEKYENKIKEQKIYEKGGKIGIEPQQIPNINLLSGIKEIEGVKDLTLAKSLFLLDKVFDNFEDDLKSTSFKGGSNPKDVLKASIVSILEPYIDKIKDVKIPRESSNVLKDVTLVKYRFDSQVDKSRENDEGTNDEGTNDEGINDEGINGEGTEIRQDNDKKVTKEEASLIYRTKSMEQRLIIFNVKLFKLDTNPGNVDDTEIKTLLTDLNSLIIELNKKIGTMNSDTNEQYIKCMAQVFKFTMNSIELHQFIHNNLKILNDYSKIGNMDPGRSYIFAQKYICEQMYKIILKKKEETTTSYKNCYKSGLGKILTTLNPEIFHKLLTSLDKRISLLYSSYRANNQSGTIPIGIKKNIQDIIDEDSHREPSKKIIYSPSIIKDYRWIYNQLFVEKSGSQEEGGPKGPPLATPPVLDEGDSQPPGKKISTETFSTESLQPSSWNNDHSDDEEHSLPPSSLGSPVGSSNGSPLGSPVGSSNGSPLGSPVGSPVGSPLGSLNGSQLETPNGTPLGSPLASLNGSQVGTPNGSPVGSPLTSPNGSPLASPVGIDPQVRGIGTRKKRNALIGLNLNEEPLTPPTPPLPTPPLPTPPLPRLRPLSNFERTRKGLIDRDLIPEGFIDPDISSKPRFPRNQTPFPRRPLSIDPNGTNALAIAGKLGRVSDPIISNLAPIPASPQSSKQFLRTGNGSRRAGVEQRRSAAAKKQMEKEKIWGGKHSLKSRKFKIRVKL